MSHCSVFKKSNNAEGFISVICHRERYLEELKAEGWCLTPEEAMSAPSAIDTDSEREALIAKAKELGISRPGNKSNDTLLAEIVEIESL